MTNQNKKPEGFIAIISLLIISTIRAFSNGKIKISSEKKVIDADGKLISGYNLTDEIDEIVKGTIL